MPIISTGTSRSTGFNGRGFLVANTLTPSFRIAGKVAYLIGEMVGPEEEFIFQAQLFGPPERPLATIIDNFPKAPAPSGWHQRRATQGQGYDLVHDATATVLFGYRVKGSICYVVTQLYDVDGSLIGKNRQDDFIMVSGSMKFGQTARIAEG